MLWIPAAIVLMVLESIVGIWAVIDHNLIVEQRLILDSVEFQNRKSIERFLNRNFTSCEY